MREDVCPVTMNLCNLVSCQDSCLRLRVQERIHTEGIPVGSDHPDLIAAGAPPLEYKIGPRELSDHLDAIAGEVNTWLLANFGRDDTDTAVEAWDRIDRLIGSLLIHRRDLGVLLARRLPDEYVAVTRDDENLVVHRQATKTEKWNGAKVITDLAQPVIDSNGERIDAVPAEVLRAVLPACGEGMTSSKWKWGELRKHLQAELYRDVEWGDAVIARGPLAYQARNTKPPKDEPEANDG